jgi:hypothetical protein
LYGEEAGDWQGTSVDMSADGSTITVGADRSDVDGKNIAGVVRIYKLNETGVAPVWTQLGQTLSGEGSADQFGSSHFSISDNGDCLAVGANHNNDGQGKGYLYQWSNSLWNVIAAASGNLKSDEFGKSPTVN